MCILQIRKCREFFLKNTVKFAFSHDLHFQFENYAPTPFAKRALPKFLNVQMGIHILCITLHQIHAP